MADVVEAEPKSELQAVMAFCQRYAVVDVGTLMAEFLDLPQALLDSRIIPALLSRRVLEPTSQPDKRASALKHCISSA